LKQILDEEKSANESLNELAHTSLNREALADSGENGSENVSSGAGKRKPARGSRSTGGDRGRATSVKRRKRVCSHLHWRQNEKPDNRSGFFTHGAENATPIT
jgi:hypothetical protein